MSRPEKFTSTEIEQSFLGSYMLSPEDGTGHYIVFALMDIYYAQYSKDIIEDIYDTSTPPPPKLHMPNWHIPKPDYQETNSLLWYNLLTELQPQYHKKRDKPSDKVRDLLLNLTQKDIKFFDARKNRLAAKTTVTHDPSEISLVKSLFIEKKYADKTEFYKWLVPQVNAQIHFAHTHVRLPDDWIVNLHLLADTWNTSFPKHPFFQNTSHNK